METTSNEVKPIQLHVPACIPGRKVEQKVENQSRFCGRFTWSSLDSRPSKHSFPGVQLIQSSALDASHRVSLYWVHHSLVSVYNSFPTVSTRRAPQRSVPPKHSRSLRS